MLVRASSSRLTSHCTLRMHSTSAGGRPLQPAGPLLLFASLELILEPSQALMFPHALINAHACAFGQALVFRSDSREVETFVELIARNCIKGQLPPSVPLDRLRALSLEAAPDQRRLFDLMYTR